MQIAAGGAGGLATGRTARKNGSEQRYGRNYTEPLMNLEHVRSLVEARLILGTSLSLGGRQAQILQSRGCRTGGRRLGLILLGLIRGISLGLVRIRAKRRKLCRHGAR